MILNVSLLVALLVPAVLDKTRPLCYETSSATCEWIYFNDPNYNNGLADCGGCGNIYGQNGDECLNVDQWVWHIDSSENAIVDPYAITSPSGKQSFSAVGTVTCGTRGSCAWKCKKNLNNVWRCVENELTFAWEFSKTEAGGSACP